MKMKRKRLFIGSIVLLGLCVAVKLGLIPAVFTKVQDALSNAVTIQYDDSLRGGEGAVVSPDMEEMVFCKGTREFFVRDLKSGSITAHPTQDKIFQVKYSPDGRYLVAGRNVVNRETGQITVLATDAPLIPVANNITAFSPDSRMIAIVNDQPGLNPRPYTVEIWDLQTGVLRQTLSIQEYYITLTGYGSSIHGMSFSKDGRYLAAAGRMITIWDIPNGNCVKTFVTKPKAQYPFNKYTTDYTALTYSPDGKYIIAGFISVYIRPEFDPSVQENVIEIWDVEQGEVVKTLDWENRITAQLMYSPDGRYLVTGRAVGRGDNIRDAVWIWDAGNWQVVKKLTQFPDYHIQAMGYSGDGSYLWASGDWHMKMWKMK